MSKISSNLKLSVKQAGAGDRVLSKKRQIAPQDRAMPPYSGRERSV
jgi:hypothetical protein